MDPTFNNNNNNNSNNNNNKNKPQNNYPSPFHAILQLYDVFFLGENKKDNKLKQTKNFQIRRRYSNLL